MRDLTKYRLERSAEFLEESKMLLENGSFKGNETVNKNLDKVA